MSTILDPEWHIVDSPPPLPDEQLHIWRVDLTELPCLRDWLSAHERQRLSGMHERVAHRFCAMRAALRHLLGRYCAASERALQLAISSAGKPRLKHPPGPDFNISHSQDHGLLAFSRGREVGVDLEVIRELPAWRNIARRTFDSEVFDALQQHRDPIEPFFQAWTALEARQKCVGQGIFAPAASDHLGLRHFRAGGARIGAVAWGAQDSQPSISFYQFASDWIDG